MIVRLLMFVLALALAADAVLPTRRETLRVDGHELVTHQRLENEYRLHFTGGRVGSCKVGFTVYDRLRDGDDVLVTSTRLLRTCDFIARGEDVLQSGGHRWLLMAGAVVLLLGAMGVLRPDRRRRRWDDTQPEEGPRGWRFWADNR